MTFAECSNCQTTEQFTNDYLTDDGVHAVLCDDCLQEVRRIEALADTLAAQPGCEVREQIIDAGEPTNTLVNRLRAHDMSNCVACQEAFHAAEYPAPRKPAAGETARPAAEEVA